VLKTRSKKCLNYTRAGKLICLKLQSPFLERYLLLQVELVHEDAPKLAYRSGHLEKCMV
jgi:hypothetical protein